MHALNNGDLQGYILTVVCQPPWVQKLSRKHVWISLQFYIRSYPVEAFGLKGMSTGVVELPPTPGSTPIYRLCNRRRARVLPVRMHLSKMCRIIPGYDHHQSIKQNSLKSLHLAWMWMVYTYIHDCMGAMSWNLTFVKWFSKIIFKTGVIQYITACRKPSVFTVAINFTHAHTHFCLSL